MKFRLRFGRSSVEEHTGTSANHQSREHRCRRQEPAFVGSGSRRGRGCRRRDAGDRFEVERDVVRGLEPLRRLFFQAVADDAFESWGDIGGGSTGAGRKVRRVFVEDGGHGFGTGIALEGALTGEHFVEDAAEAEDVRAVIDGVAADLFGRHVADGTEDLPGVGLRCGYGDSGGGFGGGVRFAELGQPEVQNFQATVAKYEDVVRLEVAVDDAFFVRGGEPVGELYG